MRRAIAAILSACLLLLTSALPASAGLPTVVVGGTAVALGGNPLWVNGVMLIPVKPVVDALGGRISWDPGSFTAIIGVGTLTIQVRVGTREALVNGRQVPLFAPVVLKDGVLYLPTGFLLATFGDQVTVTDPLLQNAIALSLLARSKEMALRNFDLTLDQHVEVAVVDRVIPFDTHAQLKFRDNKPIHLMSGTGWTPGSQPAVSPPLLGLKPWEALYPYTREAHLGDRRIENGQFLQDVVLTVDGAALRPLVDSLLAGFLPGSGLKVSVGWTQVTAVVTVDLINGYVVRQVIDAAGNGVAASGPLMQPFGLSLHQVMTFVPADANTIRPPVITG